MATQTVIPTQTFTRNVAPTPGWAVPAGTTRIEAVITFPGTVPDTTVVDVLVEASPDNVNWRVVATDHTEGGVGSVILAIAVTGGWLRASATISGHPTFGVALTVG